MKLRTNKTSLVDSVQTPIISNHIYITNKTVIIFITMVVWCIIILVLGCTKHPNTNPLFKTNNNYNYSRVILFQNNKQNYKKK